MATILVGRVNIGRIPITVPLDTYRVGLNQSYRASNRYHHPIVDAVLTTILVPIVHFC